MLDSLLLTSSFQLFGLAHCLMLLLTIAIAYFGCKYLRSGSTDQSEKTLRYTLAGALLLAVFLDPVLTLIRYGTGSQGWELLLSSALPLYLCDVVSILLALSLIYKSQRFAEIGYLWGLAGTVQGLITPTLWFGWDTIEFYVFFLQHGGVPVAAIWLVWGLGLAPEKGAFKRALCWSWGYMAVVMGINFLIDQNYGFLNAIPKVATLFDYMGPYPYYLITLQAIAFSLYFILLKIAPSPAPQKSRI